MAALEIQQAIGRIEARDILNPDPLESWKEFGLREKAVLSMLPLHGGHVRNTCRYLGIQTAWVKKRMKVNAAFRHAVKEVTLNPQMMIRAMAGDLLGVVSQKLIEMLHMDTDRRTQLEAMKFTTRLAGVDIDETVVRQSNFIRAETITMFPSARETERQKLIEGNGHVVEDEDLLVEVTS